jgi:hypothetical protein
VAPDHPFECDEIADRLELPARADVPRQFAIEVVMKVTLDEVCEEALGQLAEAIGRGKSGDVVRSSSRLDCHNEGSRSIARLWRAAIPALRAISLRSVVLALRR